MLKCSKISEIVSLEPISPLLLHFQRARYNVKGFSYAVWTPCYHSHFIGNETEGQTGSVIQPRSFSCYALLLSFKPSFLSLKPSSDSWHLDLRVSSIPIPCFHCPWAFTLFRLPEIVYLLGLRLVNELKPHWQRGLLSLAPSMGWCWLPHVRKLVSTATFSASCSGSPFLPLQRDFSLFLL